MTDAGGTGPAGAVRSGRKRFLVMVRAGPESLHPLWLGEPGKRDFDILVSAYSPNAPRPQAPGVTYVDIPGWKVSGYRQTFDREWERISQYTHVALLDDDLETDAETISKCFRDGAALELDVWQPSLTHDSYFTYAAFLHNPAFKVRYTNFIEMMCPFFSRDALSRARGLFGLGYEAAIDLVWCKLWEDNRYRCAILDQVRVRHTRPVAALAHVNGFADGKRYEDDIDALLSETHQTFRGNVVYSAVTADGHALDSRLAIALRYLPVAGGVVATPVPKRRYLKVWQDSVRHVLTRPINLGYFDVEAFLARRRHSAGSPAGSLR